MSTRIQIALGILGLLTIIATPIVFAPKAQAASVFSAQYGGYTNGYWRGPRDGQCWNNKRGC